MSYTDSTNNAKVITQTGSFSVGVSSGWISLNLAQTQSGTAIKKSDNNTPSGSEISSGLFGIIPVSSSPLPCLITLIGSSYFVSVLGEQKVNFTVNYQDSYSNVPSTGYPCVTYWKQGTNNYTTLTLSLISGAGSTGVYTATVSLSAGIYCYKYSAKNSNYPSVYDLPQSSFVVAGRPPVCANIGIADSAVVSNGKIVLRWGSASGGGASARAKKAPASVDNYYYNLYFGTDPNNLSILYSGTSTYCEVNALDFNKKYYWQVETVNEYGLSSKTQVYSFTTILPITKAFNYPNPFNPAKNQTTNIVFNMNSSGFTEIFIYSELGNLCWHTTVYDLPKGANEIIYNGKDDSGNIMYNGTYPCIIKKKYADREEKDKCRILIIK